MRTWMNFSVTFNQSSFKNFIQPGSETSNLACFLICYVPPGENPHKAGRTDKLQTEVVASLSARPRLECQLDCGYSTLYNLFLEIPHLSGLKFLHTITVI